MEEVFVVVILIMIVIFVLTFLSIKVVGNNDVGILEKLGVYERTLEPGIHATTPFLTKVTTYSLGEQTQYLKKCTFETTDGEVDMECHVRFKIEDVKLFHYGLKSESVLMFMKQSLTERMKEFSSVDLKLNEIEVSKIFMEKLKETTPSVGIDILEIKLHINNY